MKNIRYIFIAILVLAVFAVNYDLNKRYEKKHPTAVSEQVARLSAPAVAAVAAAVAAPTPVKKQISFTEKFKKEAVAVGQLQDDPDAVEKRLRDLAKGMTQDDVQSMFEIISDDHRDSDQRALAVELLSLKNDTASLVALQNFVANDNNVNGTKWDRKKEFETVLRAQAVESIGAYPEKSIALSTLSYLKSKVDEKFLSDRISRVTAHIYGAAPAAEDQDEAALKKLLE